MLLTISLLGEDRQEDESRERSLSKPCRRSRSRLVFVPEDLLDNMSFEPPNQEDGLVTTHKPPRRQACHWLRKLVRALNGQERKVVRLLYYKGLPPVAVQQVMGLSRSALKKTLNGAFAKLREQLRPLLLS